MIMDITLLLYEVFLTLPAKNPTGYLYSQEEKFVAEKYKFEMNIPDGFRFTTKIVDEWGIMKGVHNKTNTILWACSREGEYTKKQVYDFGIEKSGIPKAKWVKVANGENKNGFLKWERFRSDHNNKTMFALIGKNASSDFYYLFFVLGPTKQFKKHESKYLDWIKSFKGL